MTFLSFIAESGVFNISGNNVSALENAKRAPLYQVLTYASEKKDYEEMVNNYYESLNK